ncbi:MAG: hypothetical protein GTO63_28930 [Anaerolineae bacterium]|nr:hypothetical protein [Anaerolineae bacterium]NIQ81680.1 hypothetical protein [Anaerolineae bacterium]
MPKCKVCKKKLTRGQFCAGIYCTTRWKGWTIDNPPKVEDRVYSRGGKFYGVRTGGTRFCRLEGCGGRRHGVRWLTGKITWPCGKGMKVRKDGALQIV